MNAKLLLATVVTLSLAIHAGAQQADNAPAPAARARLAAGIEPQKTRAEVIAELQRAQKDGTDMPTGFVAEHTPANSMLDGKSAQKQYQASNKHDDGQGGNR